MDKFLDDEIVLLNSRLKDAKERIEHYNKRKDKENLDIAIKTVDDFERRIFLINDIKLEKDEKQKKELILKYLNFEIDFTQKSIECLIMEKESWEKSEDINYPKYIQYKEEELIRIQKEMQEYQERLERLQKLKDN